MVTGRAGFIGFGLLLIAVGLGVAIGAMTVAGAAQPVENTSNNTQTPGVNASENESTAPENDPWTATDENTNGDGNETGPDQILAQLGDVTLVDYQELEGNDVEFTFYAEEPRRIQIDTPYTSIEGEGVGDVEPASLEETRLSRGENTVVVSIPDSEANHRTAWIYANDLRVPVTVEMQQGTAVNELAPMAALLLGAIVGLSTFIFGAWRAIRRGKGSVRRAEP